MSEPFLGEIKAVGFNFAPVGWAKCYGQMIPIAQNSALYALFGTFYGGDGRTTFGLPDLRGRMIVGEGQGPGLTNKYMGYFGGWETTTLTYAQMPSHTHGASISGTATGTFKPNASTQGATDQSPAGKIFAASQTNDTDRPKPIRSYIDPSASDTEMAENSVNINLNGSNIQIENSGSGQSFSIMQPFTTLNYIVALVGLFPSRS